MVALSKVYGPGSSDFVQWRIKHKVPFQAKVFCISGGSDSGEQEARSCENLMHAAVVYLGCEGRCECCSCLKG